MADNVFSTYDQKLNIINKVMSNDKLNYIFKMLTLGR
jgi:hypothetical protein